MLNLGFFIFKNLIFEGFIDDNVLVQDEFYVQINDFVDKYQISFIFNYMIDLFIECFLFFVCCFCLLFI